MTIEEWSAAKCANDELGATVFVSFKLNWERHCRTGHAMEFFVLDWKERPERGRIAMMRVKSGKEEFAVQAADATIEGIAVE